VLVARSREELEAVAAGIEGTAHVAPCDVTDPQAVSALAERFPVDVLVNNAGTNDPKPFTEVDEASFDRLSDLTVRATFFTTQAFARAMIARGTGGAIINVTSQMGHVGAANRTVYCTTKHAVEGLTTSPTRRSPPRWSRRSRSAASGRCPTSPPP
jgi:NAD(P)-dependent dehydrogenase (short-subunit alcohol dehydrogenase family)